MLELERHNVWLNLVSVWKRNINGGIWDRHTHPKPRRMNRVEGEKLVFIVGAGDFLALDRCCVQVQQQLSVCVGVCVCVCICYIIYVCYAYYICIEQWLYLVDRDLLKPEPK